MSETDVPVIVGFGQVVERLEAPDYVGRSPADLAADACRAALDDAAAVVDLEPLVGIVGAVRTVDDSVAGPAPFGKPDKYPLAVAARVGISPHTAILEQAGGNSPLSLLVEMGERLQSGEAKAALIFGSEAISTVRHLGKTGEKRDWAESCDGAIEDRGRGLEGIVMRHNLIHGIQGAPLSYALLENARRNRLGLSREAYRDAIGELFAPFSAAAAANPYSCAETEALAASEIATPSARNRMVADPYTLKMVSRDQVNQGAAVLLMMRSAAIAAGIPENRLIYVHASALAQERDMIYRPDPGASSAASLTLASVLSDSGRTLDEIAMFDFYSCFPIAVFAAAVDGLGLQADDPRRLTVTGGLPFFGGAGNNYSMHAIAEMGQRLRDNPGSFGLIGFNGGFLTKYGALVISTNASPWRPCRTREIQDQLDAEPMPAVTRRPAGSGTIFSYSIGYRQGEAERAIIFGVLDSGERFIANNLDADTLAEMITSEPLGRKVHAASTRAGNRFSFDRAALAEAVRNPAPGFREDYESLLIARRDHVLEVTINREEKGNALTMAASVELDEVFDAFEADPDLWVAIITGSGTRSFCAGMDLKGGQAGQLPRGGFAGITMRRTRKPVIAAVNGAALGGGFETVLACDLAVADPNATFGLTEVRVGMIAGAGGAARLPRQMPRKLAVELLLTGRAIGADEAKILGLVNRVSEPGRVIETARDLAAEIIAASPTSVRLTMQLIHEAEAVPASDEAARTMLESSAIDALMVSEDMLEGRAAFSAKRAPVWKNR